MELHTENTVGPHVDLVQQLVPEIDPILREVLPTFDFVNPSMDSIKVAHILAQSCIANDGLGLSANQIGLNVRACIIKAQTMICMFNPVIVNASEDQQSYLEEGCLTFPNLIIKIKRPDIIRVRYTRPDGVTVTEKYVGLTSKIIQHEIDHLNGILFMDRAHPVHMITARTKKKKYDRIDRANAKKEKDSDDR